MFSACKEKITNPIEGKNISNIKLKNIYNQDLNLLDGRPKIIHFFGLWCPTCMADDKNWDIFAQSIAKKTEIEIIDVHVSKVPDGKNLENWYKSKQYSKSSNLIYDVNSKVSNEIGIVEVPNIIVVDKYGNIVLQRMRIKSSEQAAKFANNVFKTLKM